MSFPNKLHRSDHDAADVNVTRNVSKLNKFEGIGDVSCRHVVKTLDTWRRTTTLRKLSL